MDSPNSILIPFSFTLSMLFLAKLIHIHSFNHHLLVALKPQYTCILRHPGVLFPRMIGKPGTSTTALACACYPWSSSSQPFSLESTPQYFGKYITNLFIPSLQRYDLFPCYYACKPKPPFFHPLLLLWSLPLGLHSPCQDYYHHHPLRFTSLDHPTSIQLCRNTLE